MLVKVCGLMNKEDVDLCITSGVKRLGFVTEFPVSVPWNIDRSLAKELISTVPDGIETVVVTAGDIDRIYEIAKYTGAKFVQTGFANGLDKSRELIERLNEIGVSFIGKFPTALAEQESVFGTSSLEEIVSTICGLGVAEILIDPRNKDNAAEMKLKADTKLVRKIKELSTLPVILAGGISPENIVQKLEESMADSVDVMNGSEDRPGQKSKDKIERLLAYTADM